MVKFDDGKENDALRTIGEVSEALCIKPHVLRYWEQHFSLLRPLKRSGGRRYYRPGDVALLETINQLINTEGYTLKGAEAVVRASGRSGRGDPAEAGSAAEISAPTGADEVVQKLAVIRNKLSRALEG